MGGGGVAGVSGPHGSTAGGASAASLSWFRWGCFSGWVGAGAHTHRPPPPPYTCAALCAVSNRPRRPAATTPTAPHNHLTFRFRVDSVVSFPVQYGRNGPGGGQGPRILRCSSFTPPGGRDPRLHPPLPCAYDQLLRVCFREGLHQGGLPLSPTSCETSGVSSGGCGPRSPCSERVGPRAPLPRRVFRRHSLNPLAPLLCLRGSPPGPRQPSATLGPQQHWLPPSDVEDHALGAVHLSLPPPGGTLVLSAASRVGPAQSGR